MVEKLKIGYRVVGTIKSVKGLCNADHKKGDKIELVDALTSPQILQEVKK